jgi:hypothetical protein
MKALRRPKPVDSDQLFRRAYDEMPEETEEVILLKLADMVSNDQELEAFLGAIPDVAQRELVRAKVTPLLSFVPASVGPVDTPVDTPLEPVVTLQ